MKHLGNITEIRGEHVAVVDCVIGGSPCQDLSVAGKRAGLCGERSALYLEQIRIIKEMRAREKRMGWTGVDVRPRYMVWENVPGAISSNGGEDFRIVLEEAARVADPDAVIPRPAKWKGAGCIMADGWSIAWRILDAQFWGVPQRRRRIALVADFGGQSAPEILFVRESVSGNSDAGGEKRKTASRDAEDGTASGDRKCFAGSFGLTVRYGNKFEEDKTPTLTTALGDNTMAVVLAVRDRAVDCFKGVTPCVVYKGDGAVGGETSFAIVGDHESRPSDMTNLVVEMDRAAYNQGKNAQFDIGISENGIAHTAVAKGPGAVAYCYPEVNRGVVGTIDAHISQTPGARGGVERTIVYSCDCRNAKEDTVSPTLQGNAAHSLNGGNVVRIGYIVRRLTPLECERLQGYPDGWTDIGAWVDAKGKTHESSDAARYRALGNSIALPQWKWVLKRLCSCYERNATMASLFDGIGGFPFLWEQINGKGSCLWASEIEEFPIAVTKKRIGGEDDE